MIGRIANCIADDHLLFDTTTTTQQQQQKKKQTSSRDVEDKGNAELKRILQELGTVNVDRVCSPTEAMSLSRTAVIDLLIGLEQGVSLPSSDDNKALRQITEIRRLFDLVEARIVNRSTPLDRLCEDLDGWIYANGQRYSSECVALQV